VQATTPVSNGGTATQNGGFAFQNPAQHRRHAGRVCQILNHSTSFQTMLWMAAMRMPHIGSAFWYAAQSADNRGTMRRVTHIINELEDLVKSEQVQPNLLWLAEHDRDVHAILHEDPQQVPSVIISDAQCKSALRFTVIQSR